MISVDVQGDTKAVLRDIRFVSKDLALRAQIFAVNRSAQATETRVRRETAKHVGVAQRWVRPKMKSLRATFYRRRALLLRFAGGISSAYDAGKRPKGKLFAGNKPQGGRAIWYRSGRPKHTPAIGRYAGTGIQREPINISKIALIPTLLSQTERFLRTFTPGEYRKVFTRDLVRRLRNTRLFR